MMFISRFYMAALLVSASAAFAWSADYTTAGIEQAKSHAKDGGEFRRLPMSWKASAEDKAKAAKAWEIIRDWQADGAKDHRKLHVVYVTLKDRPALKDYKGRIDRIVKNVQMFYADQMEENGFPPLTFGLDLDKDGKLVVHDAYLDEPLSKFNVNSSGPATSKVAFESLRKAGVDPDRDYVLIVAQMPDKVGPYYGGGTSEAGVCWICDAEHLDPLNFSSTEAGPYLFKTVGNDNTVYIGGTAHELGHCFSLPHTRELQRAVAGASLMGNGNYSYGEEFRNEGRGAFLIQSDALRLASIPLFTGKSRRAEDAVEARLSDMTAEPIDGGLRLAGKVQGNPPVYGLVAYFDPAGGDDYDASTTTCIPGPDGSFSLDAVRPGYKGDFELRLVMLQADGKTATFKAGLSSGDQGVEVAPLQRALLLMDVEADLRHNRPEAARAKFDALLVKYGADARFVRDFAIWKRAFEEAGAPQGASPAVAPASERELDLTVAAPAKAQAGYGRVCWGYCPFELPYYNHGPVPELTKYKPGTFIRTHANGTLTYDLGGAWKELSLQYGSPAFAYGPTRLTVKGDGKVLAQTGFVRQGENVPVNVSVDGVKDLTLEVSNNPEKGNGGCSAIICDPMLKR